MTCDHVKSRTYYCSKPRTIEAVHFEEAGTYEVFDTKIEIREKDSYAYMQEGHLVTMSGDRFRRFWEPEPEPV